MQLRTLDGQALRLDNRGYLSLFAVGCGAAFTKTLGNNNWIVIHGAHHVLIDCGSKTPARLHHCGVDPTDIEAFLPTHSHGDHIGGLEEVMLRARYVRGTRPLALIEAEYQHQLWAESLRGGGAYNEQRGGRNLEFEDFWQPLRPQPCPDLPRNAVVFNYGPLDLKLFRTNHMPQQARSWQEAAYSVAVLINERILFTGDTKFDPDLLLQLDAHFDLELILHDAQHRNGGLHASIEELATLPESVRARTLLMHYDDHWQQRLEAVERLGFRGFAHELTYYDFAERY